MQIHSPRVHKKKEKSAVYLFQRAKVRSHDQPLSFVVGNSTRGKDVRFTRVYRAPGDTDFARKKHRPAASC